MQAPLVFRDLGSVNKESLIRDNAQATPNSRGHFESEPECLIFVHHKIIFDDDGYHTVVENQSCIMMPKLGIDSVVACSEIIFKVRQRRRLKRADLGVARR
jgi:hypothetical protein